MVEMIYSKISTSEKLRKKLSGLYLPTTSFPNSFELTYDSVIDVLNETSGGLYEGEWLREDGLF